MVPNVAVSVFRKRRVYRTSLCWTDNVGHNSTCVILSWIQNKFNSLNAELRPIGHLLALLGAHHILHVSRIRVKCIVVSCICRQLQ
jgi:hypothetical protein